jgi:hypothetical protein
MGELSYDSDVFKYGAQGIDDSSTRVAAFLSRLEALRERTQQAAGAGSDGSTFMGSVSPSIDAAHQGLKAVVTGLDAARLNLQDTSKILQGANDANNASVPRHDSPAMASDRLVARQPAMVTYQTAERQPAMVTYQTVEGQPAVASGRSAERQPAMAAHETVEGQPAVASGRSAERQPGMVTYETVEGQPAIAAHIKNGSVKAGQVLGPGMPDQAVEPDTPAQGDAPVMTGRGVEPVTAGQGAQSATPDQAVQPDTPVAQAVDPFMTGQGVDPVTAGQAVGDPVMPVPAVSAPAPEIALGFTGLDPVDPVPLPPPDMPDGQLLATQPPGPASPAGNPSGGGGGATA